MNLQSLIWNKSALKRIIKIYIPIFVIGFLVLHFFAWVTTKSANDFLDLSQSFDLKTPIIYNDQYNISFGGLEAFHPFDTHKYGRIYQGLLDEGTLKKDDFIIAAKPTETLLKTAHSQQYLKSLSSSWTLASITELGFLRFFPSALSRNIILEPMLYQTGGSILAAEVALQKGWAINLGGGFHHASYNNGEGFCALADISLIAKYLQQEKQINRIMIIDLDAHQGNGHGLDFKDDDDVFIFDIYNEEIYPNDIEAKKGIDLKIELLAFTSDNVFLTALKTHLPSALDAFKPDTIIYVAGTDILQGDPLGAMNVSKEGIIKRDEFVFKEALDRNVPIIMLLSGGYQKSNADIITESILNLHKELEIF